MAGIVKLGRWSKLVVAFGVAFLAVAAVGHRVGAVNAQEPPTFTAPFNAQVMTGDLAGTTVNGMLNVRLTTTGEFNGVLAMDNGQQVAVHGYSAGISVSIGIMLPDGSAMFGTGAASAPLAGFTQNDIGGGQLVVFGPDGHESAGVWALRCTNNTNQLCAL